MDSPLVNHSINSSNKVLSLQLILASVFMTNFLNCDIKNIMNNNLIVKHLLGLFIVIHLMDAYTIKDFPFAVFIYLWFILSMKMDKRFWMGLMVILSLIYFMEMFRKKSISLLPAQRLKLKQLQLIMVGLGFILTLVGVFFNQKSQKQLLGNGFNYTNFLLGNNVCGHR